MHEWQKKLQACLSRRVHFGWKRTNEYCKVVHSQQPRKRLKVCNSQHTGNRQNQQTHGGTRKRTAHA